MALNIPERWLPVLDRIEHWTQWLLLLGFRVYVASVFFRSGLVKIQSWDSTVSLFENEYAVPVLSPIVAAYLASFGELVFPVLLTTGLATRFAALGLFVLNAVAATSYPDLSPAGMEDHIMWGSMLITVAVFGPGDLAIDRWLWRKKKP